MSEKSPYKVIISAQPPKSFSARKPSYLKIKATKISQKETLNMEFSAALQVIKVLSTTTKI